MARVTLYKKVPDVSAILGAFDAMRQRLNNAAEVLQEEAERQTGIASELVKSSEEKRGEARRASVAASKLGELTGFVQ